MHKIVLELTTPQRNSLIGLVKFLLCGLQPLAIEGLKADERIVLHKLLEAMGVRP